MIYIRYRGQMAEHWDRLPVDSRLCQMTLCPWARHFNLLASGECPCTYCKSVRIRASAKCKCRYINNRAFYKSCGSLNVVLSLRHLALVYYVRVCMCACACVCVSFRNVITLMGLYSKPQWTSLSHCFDSQTCHFTAGLCNKNAWSIHKS